MTSRRHVLQSTASLVFADARGSTAAGGTSANDLRSSGVDVLGFMSSAEAEDVQSGAGKLDVTDAVQRAFDYVSARPTGGTLIFPAGTYSVRALDFSSAQADFSKRVTLQGVNAQASKIILNTAGVGIDCLGRQGISFKDLYVTSGRSSPSVGILFGRSTRSKSSTWHSLQNVFVWGNFSQACVATICAESNSFIDCNFNNLNDAGGLAFYCSQRPTGVKLDGEGSYSTFTVQSPHGSIFISSNTDIAFVRCIFYCYGRRGIPLSIDSQLQATFVGCAFLPTTPGTTACVLITDLGATPYNGPTVFYGCLFESGYANGIVFRSVRASPAFQKIVVDACYFNLFSQTAESVTYSGSSSGTFAVSELTYRSNTRSGTEQDSVSLDFVERSTIDLARGTFKIRSGALSSQLRGTRVFTNSPELITWRGNDYPAAEAKAVPVSGVYVAGEKVWNSTPAPGDYIGWVAIGSGAAWFATRANGVNYKVGSWIRDVATPGSPVYEVIRDAKNGNGLSGRLALRKPAAVGIAVSDGDLTLTLRSNQGTTLLPFGRLVS